MLDAWDLIEINKNAVPKETLMLMQPHVERKSRVIASLKPLTDDEERVSEMVDNMYYDERDY